TFFEMHGDHLARNLRLDLHLFDGLDVADGADRDRHVLLFDGGDGHRYSRRRPAGGSIFLFGTPCDQYQDGKNENFETNAHVFEIKTTGSAPSLLAQRFRGALGLIGLDVYTNQPVRKLKGISRN